MSNLALEISNLNLISRGHHILEDIDFKLYEEDFVGLIGPNGAGKTVFLKTILGLIKPSSGEIKIYGQAPEKARGLISYVPQFANFDANFPINVKDVVMMGRIKKKNILKRFSNSDLEITNQCLEKLELQNLAHREIGRLSGGQLQRVLIARALASEPKILLLDEPTASLDTRVGTDVFQVLADISKTTSIILVSHDVGSISSYVKTIACLNKNLHYHHDNKISSEVIHQVYGCPIELISHGHAHAHRILPIHDCNDCDQHKGKK